MSLFKAVTLNEKKEQNQSLFLHAPYSNYYIFICLTLQVCITRWTLTQIAVDLIYVGTAVLTGCTNTSIYVCKTRVHLF